MQVRLLLLAALAGEHLLLLGPPGTAKSELARRMARLTGGRYFERLLTRFSVPEELFGPLSMKGVFLEKSPPPPLCAPRALLPNPLCDQTDHLYLTNTAQDLCTLRDTA